MTRTIGIMSMSLDGFVADPDGTESHFVHDGIQSPVEQAKDAAGDGADTIQQCLNAGLLDELAIDVSAVLLGSGVRMFEHLDGTPFALGDPTVTQGAGVTHLRYPVRR